MGYSPSSDGDSIQRLRPKITEVLTNRNPFDDEFPVTTRFPKIGKPGEARLAAGGAPLPQLKHSARPQACNVVPRIAIVKTR
jgi:hypothetical protein